MVSIDARLGAIKRDPSDLLDPDRVMELCRKHDYWPEADGALDPTTLIALFMRQVAVGNVSCDQVRLMGNDAFTSSGYCQMHEVHLTKTDTVQLQFEMLAEGGNVATAIMRDGLNKAVRNILGLKIVWRNASFYVS